MHNTSQVNKLNSNTIQNMKQNHFQNSRAGYKPQTRYFYFHVHKSTLILIISFIYQHIKPTFLCKAFLANCRLSSWILVSKDFTFHMGGRISTQLKLTNSLTEHISSHDQNHNHLHLICLLSKTMRKICFHLVSWLVSGNHHGVQNVS